MASPHLWRRGCHQQLGREGAVGQVTAGARHAHLVVGAEAACKEGARVHMGKLSNSSCCCRNCPAANIPRCCHACSAPSVEVDGAVSTEEGGLAVVIAQDLRGWAAFSKIASTSQWQQTTATKKAPLPQSPCLPAVCSLHRPPEKDCLLLAPHTKHTHHPPSPGSPRFQSPGAGQTSCSAGSHQSSASGGQGGRRGMRGA